MVSCLEVNGHFFGLKTIIYLFFSIWSLFDWFLWVLFFVCLSFSPLRQNLHVVKYRNKQTNKFICPHNTGSFKKQNISVTQENSSVSQVSAKTKCSDSHHTLGFSFQEFDWPSFSCPHCLHAFPFSSLAKSLRPPSIYTTLLSYILPPLIWTLLLQFPILS